MAKEIRVNKLYQGFEKEKLIKVEINSKNVFGKDLYAILEIPRDAEKNAVRKAYLKLSPKYHPNTKPVRTPELDEKWSDLQLAYQILFDDTWKWTYDNKFDNGNLGLNKVNDYKHRQLLIKELEDKNVNQNGKKYLPQNLHDWQNKIRYQGDSATFDQINSYASRILAIVGTLRDIEVKINGLHGMKLFSFVERFADPESKDEVEEVFKKIVQEINQESDKQGKSKWKDKLKREKIKELKNLANFSILIKYNKDKYFEERILNSFAEENEKGNIVKTLEKVINDILKDAKETIKSLLDKEQKDNKLNPIKKDYIKKLHRLNGWNELLEPWEQDDLEAKINNISEDKTSLFDNCITYAQKVITGGHLRKYRAGFWNKLEELTNLKKEDIFQDDGSADKKKKVGERYESINANVIYKGIEPKPQALDGPQFLKMKLFICYYKKEASFQWPFLLIKLNNLGYDKDIDSGWMPSKRDNNLLKFQWNEAITIIEKQLENYGILGILEKENKSLGINWRKRFEMEGEDSNKIKKIREDFLERAYNYKIENNPHPWKGGENLPPPKDPLKKEKEEAIAKILKEAFEKDPVINKDKLEKDNQNWESDINNASKEEEIGFIKTKVIHDIQKKRAKAKEKNNLDDLISEAKKDENWNNYQNLKNLLKQIKKLQFSDLYKKNESEIYAIEKRIKELNPEDFKNSIKNDFDEKIKNSGLSQEEITDETKELIDEAIESGDLEKKTKVEEAIIQEGVNKKLNDVIIIVKKAIKKGNLTNAQKEELTTKILECISENEYQKKAYQKQKDKVENLLSELRGETTKEQESPEFSWLKKIGIAAVISLSITILVSVAMKISSHRKRRNTQ